MVLQPLEGKGCQGVLCGCAGVDVRHKEVPVVEADLEDLILFHKRNAEQVLQTLEQKALVLRLLQHAYLSLRMTIELSAFLPSLPLQGPGHDISADKQG